MLSTSPGCVSISESALLSDLRRKINDELDGIPEFFVFVSDEVCLSALGRDGAGRVGKHRSLERER
jgi:hypothetical protein